MHMQRFGRSHDSTSGYLNAQVKPDEEYDWAVRYQGALRSIPLAAGALGICGVLANRVVSGVSGDVVYQLSHCIKQAPCSACSGSVATVRCCLQVAPPREPSSAWCVKSVLD